MLNAFDPFEEARLCAQTLVSAVAAALSRLPSFDGLQIRPKDEVIVVNAVADEQPTWNERAKALGGPGVRVLFVTRPGRPGVKGFSMIAARGCGTLDFQHFECGCRAAQIPGEGDWQLVRGTHCRFTAHAHAPKGWPVDASARPAQMKPAPDTGPRPVSAFARSESYIMS